MVKLIIYALLAYVAWRFVRGLLDRLGVAPAGQQKRPAAGRTDAPAQAPRLDAQDLVKCTVCGSYVAARCGRTNCPQ
jgi:hypothetical protein